jgi:hypothetical protein
MFLTMVILAAFLVLYTYTCSAPSSMPEGYLWGSNTFSPAFKRSFQLLQQWVNIVVGCWHSTTCYTTTPANHLQPRKHVRTKPPPLSLINNDRRYAFTLRRRFFKARILLPRRRNGVMVRAAKAEQMDWSRR